jgi:hypothetical protein
LYSDRGSIGEAISNYTETMNLLIVGGDSTKGHKLQCENSEPFLNNEFCDTQKIKTNHYSEQFM